MKKILFFSAAALVLFSSFVASDKSNDLNVNPKANIVSSSDEIISIDAPDVIKSKSEVEIIVKYSASSTRDIFVFLQNTNDWSWPVYQVKTVNAGAGSFVIKVKVPRLPESVDQYRWGVFITPVGAGFDKKIGDESFVFDVDVVNY